MAARWYLVAAQAGNADAQCRLAALYERGAGLPRNLEEAMRWRLRAASQGDGLAMAALAAHYAEGKGVERDAGRRFVATPRRPARESGGSV
ncbi:MAG: hypothetical protein R2748_09170 [Bryobacterales bacterium]